MLFVKDIHYDDAPPVYHGQTTKSSPEFCLTPGQELV